MNTAHLFGQSIAFPPRLGANGQWAWSSGPQNIRESIQIILQTEVRERLMLPSFGAGLGQFWFEPNTTATRRLIQERVENALRLWEPRIALQAVQVEAAPDDPKQVVIAIVYELIATSTREEMSLAVNLSS
jgi:phage baseplate assembly protein W